MVFFDWDRANLSDQALNTIRQAAAAFKSKGNARITATGHTDTSGPESYNMALSLRRANAVKDALVREGVPAAGDQRDRPRRGRACWCRPATACASRRTAASRSSFSKQDSQPSIGGTAGQVPAVSICAAAKRKGTVAAMPDHDAHDIIVLFSSRSRDAYAAEATARGETYTFTDAWGLPRTWVKGEYAYLAPNAAGLLLARCNLKHHLVEEAALDAARLARCRALLIANAGHLAPETIARIDAWLADGDRRLIVSGKTNLPPRLLGLQSCEPAPVQGYTGWRWRAGSPFAGDAWETLYVSGYKGHPAHRIVPAKGSRVLADLVELSGDLSDATTAAVGELGPAIVLTDKTVYVANQVLRADRRHDAGPSQRRGGAPLGQRHALGRHAAVLPAPTDARGRAVLAVADPAALVRHL